MLAKDIAIQGFPMLRLEDTAAFVLKCMEDFEVQHLPVVKEDYFIGLVNKESILDLEPKQSIAPYWWPLTYQFSFKTTTLCIAEFPIWRWWRVSMPQPCFGRFRSR
jgi:hypothetical protein